METPSITLNGIYHRGKYWIAIYCEPDATLNAVIRTLPGRTFSTTNKAWLVPLNKQHYKIIIVRLSKYATIDAAPLKAYSLLLKSMKKELPKTTTTSTESKSVPSQPNLFQLHTIAAINRPKLLLMRQQLLLKAYSKSTQKTYLNEFGMFLQHLNRVDADTFSANRIKQYLVYCHEELHLSENTLHSRINALKFYYEQVLHREKFFWDIPRPKKPLQLPKLLNEDELARLFKALSNKKHKAMLFTTYSAGLRVSELVRLKIADVDSGSMQLFIEKAKGKKDRYVNLSPVLLDILRHYISSTKPKPKQYLFESEATQGAYAVRTVQQIFQQARIKAGISKTVGIHSLRHSFATHLLDKGTDIRYIKDLLGHFNIKTTERYLHVSKQQLVNIVSPLDDLFRKEKISW